MVRIAAVCMVRNECDIVEYFVRHNSLLFDHIYFLNHFSSDSTLQILELLKADGFPLSVTHLRDPSYRQADFTTAAVRSIANSGRFDFIMPLDADEFPEIDRPTFVDCLNERVTVDGIGKIPWKTFCPVPVARQGRSEAWAARFRARSQEVRQFYKVVLGRGAGEACRISTGNHTALTEALIHDIPILPFSLQHVPIRSSAQIVRKALIGKYSFDLGGRLHPNEGHHWSAMIRQCRENRYVFADAELARMAQRYSLIDSDPTPEIEMSEELMISGVEAAEHGQLADIHLVEALDHFIQDMLQKR